MKKILLPVVLLFISCSLRAQSFDPVNKAASPEVKKVLRFLYSVSGKNIISGQHNYNHEMNTYSDSAKSITGKYPGLWGTDFIWNGTSDPGQQIVDEAIKKWHDG